MDGCSVRNTRQSVRKRLATESNYSCEKDSPNFFSKVLKRETSSRFNWSLKRRSFREKFKFFNLQEEYETFDPSTPLFQKLSFMRQESRILEITAARGLVFTLSHSGVCAAFSRESRSRVCYLNLSPDEVVRSLFYNKYNDSIITVSVYSTDDFSTLRCRTTSLEYVRRGKPEAGFPLFETECLKYPGFVEFDDVNGKVLTFSAYNKTYSIYDLKNYNLLFCLTDKTISEIKISPGVMLLIGHRKGSLIPLKLIDIENGAELKSFDYKMKNKRIEFIEQFNDKVLVKQERENLEIIDVVSGGVLHVNSTDFVTPTAFIFLYESQLFLTFRHRAVGVWNFKGELVTEFEDHLLWHPDSNTNNIYITQSQDVIISCCKNHQTEECSINMSHVMSGSLLWKVSSVDFCGEGTAAMSKVPSISVCEALQSVTAVFYDEERNEIFTGTRTGQLHVWAN